MIEQRMSCRTCSGIPCELFVYKNKTATFILGFRHKAGMTVLCCERKIPLYSASEKFAMVTVKDKTFSPLIDEQALLKRVEVLGAAIAKDYRGKNPLFIVVLNGAFLFAAELFKRLDLECEISFIRLSSYIGTSSTGKVAFMMQLSDTVRGRDVIIIEDIVDTGKTLAHFLPHLQLEKPSSIRIASMLSKPSALKEKIKIDYLGFEIEDKFVVGFGLDYDGAGRNLPGIYQLME